MAAREAAFSIVYSSCSPISTKFQLCPRHSHPIPLQMCVSSLHPSIKSPLYPFPLLHVERTKKPSFHVLSAAGDVALEEKTEKSQKIIQKRKLFVMNLPWTFSVTDIKNLFGECGTVVDVEIIKQKDGKNRGFAFVTMASGEEAEAAASKFDSYELSGRIIRVEFAKRFRKPSRSPPADSPHRETRYKLYLSNLAWKVRSNQLRDFFSAFNPVSARVVFGSPSGKSAGYGFVSFATKEEAENALSALDGKRWRAEMQKKKHQLSVDPSGTCVPSATFSYELLSRPVRLKFSEKNVEESSEEKDEQTEEQPKPS